MAQKSFLREGVSVRRKKIFPGKLVWLFLSLGVFYLLEGAMVPLPGEEGQEKAKQLLLSFLPAEKDGWRPEGEEEIYTPETIFSYIDGAGEVYRAYGFRWLLVRRYQKEGMATIIVDLFLLGRSEDAFGVFTHDLEGERVSIGQDGLYKGGWLAFWKDKYYVSIYSDQETPEIKKAILSLGEAIAQGIPHEGNRPDILNLLPEEAEPGQVHYFHTLPLLNYHFFVTTENWLDLDQTTEAALVRLKRTEKEKTHLLVIAYPEGERAQRAMRQFFDFYLPEADESGLARTEDGFWTGAKVKDKVIVIVFNAATEAEAEALLNKVISKISDKGNKNK